ncbi:MAG: Gfo/Idh/MocA family oxidoreductase [Phycisphaerae bacterium]|nr:Gfo/Idh/MocA family oxidoreductase [Phycisphaerae bacterium]
MSKIGIGIIGSGFMGRTYAETISRYCSRAKLRAVACGSRAGQLAQDYGVPLESSAEALIARDDVAAVFIATPHHLHAEQALAAAAAGKHILLEKPMACTVADCDAIIEACRSANAWCTIAFSQRTRQCNIKAKQLIDDGVIGRILQMQELSLVATGLAGLPKWQSDSENLGTLFGHAIHNFDRIRWFTGSEIRTVYAKCGSIEPGTRVEGTSMVLMSLTDGATAHLWESFQVPKPSFPRAQFGTWIIGERGLIDLDAYGELRVAMDGQWKVEATQAPIDWAGKGFLDPVRLESYTLQCQDFIDAIADRRPPAVTGWDGRQAVAAALACYESSRTGKEIVLPGENAK